MTQAKRNENASLTVVGAGIKFKSHLTTEAQAYIKGSDLVLYLVNEPAMRDWIIRNSRRSESLNRLYNAYPLRNDCYNAMTAYVLTELRKDQHVCFVLYGHPTIVAKPGVKAATQARAEGFHTKILPGISAEDCLFADLMINPTETGYLSYEATDFLVYLRILDSRCYVVLWQAGIIGALGYPAQHDNSDGISLLTKRLMQFYDAEHKIYLYEAAQYPHIEPLITTIKLGELQNSACSPITTLCIPPAQKSLPNVEMLKALRIAT